MSRHLYLLPSVGEAVRGVCDLAASPVDGIAGPEGVFGRTLSAVSPQNPYRAPSLPPGERAAEIEAHLLKLEAVLADRRGPLMQQGSILDMSAQLTQIARVLEPVAMTDAEGAAVLARVVAFLSDQDVAERLGTLVPDNDELLEELDEMLGKYGVSERERPFILHRIDDILNHVEEKTAA